MWTPGVASLVFEHIVSSHQWTYPLERPPHGESLQSKDGHLCAVLFPDQNGEERHPALL